MENKNNIPVYDFVGEYDLNSISDVGECLGTLVFSLEEGYFLTWEAVIRDEQGLPLSEKQEEALDGLLSFSDDEDPILYIDGLPRPNEPWYEMVRKVVPKLLLEPFYTFKIHDEIYHEGWPKLADGIENYACDLSLPEGVSTPIEVVPADIRHKLWLQYCFEELSGLGQEDELTLENNDQKSWRIEGFIDVLKEFKDSVEFFNLTLDDLLKLVVLPPKDEKILVESLLRKLNLKSSTDNLGDVL